MSFTCSTHTDRVQELLLHPHSWVRLASSRLFGQLFASSPLEELIASFVDQKEGKLGAVQIVSGLEVRMCMCVCIYEWERQMVLWKRYWLVLFDLS